MHRSVTSLTPKDLILTYLSCQILTCFSPQLKLALLEELSVILNPLSLPFLLWASSSPPWTSLPSSSSFSTLSTRDLSKGYALQDQNPPVVLSLQDQCRLPGSFLWLCCCLPWSSHLRCNCCLRAIEYAVCQLHSGEALDSVPQRQGATGV